MRHILTTVLALSLLNGAAVMAQPNNQNRVDQGDNRNDQNSNDQNRKDEGRGTPAAPTGKAAPKGATPAAPTGKATPKGATPTAPSGQATRERAAPAAPAGQAARERAIPNAPTAQPASKEAVPTAPTGEASRERAAPATPSSQATRNRNAPTAPTGQASGERAAPAEPSSQANRNRNAPTAPTGQAARDRAAPPAPNIQDQNRGPDLRNNPGVRVAAPHFSRGDRLPDQYRQNQYVVSDWQQHGLREPPRDHRWVRDDNNDFFLALIATGVITEVIYRDDRDQLWRQRYSRGYTYNDDVYYQECRNAPDPAGVIVGALIGGLLGNAAGSGRTGTTLAGVIVGGAVGAALTKNLDCEDRSYAYKSYYDGFNAGRPNAVYRWSNPRNNHRGEFRVVDYYNDPAGFRCSNYSQTIYVQGRPQEARGRACRQPDGTWAIVS
jgi:Ni/Co efflux regulator RcnB/surface antigen